MSQTWKELPYTIAEKDGKPVVQLKVKVRLLFFSTLVERFCFDLRLIIDFFYKKKRIV